MDRNRALLTQARGYVYKEAGGAELEAYVFEPPKLNKQEKKPAILFFFSGSWDTGLVSQFAPHCLHFAARGIVAVAFDYRVNSRHNTGPLEAMADARSAVRWVRYHANDLGVDPERIVGAGGSGGAFIITSAAVFKDKFDDPEDVKEISCAPNALVLFDPVFDVHSKTGFGVDRFPDAVTAKDASLIRHARKGLPPTILFHGAQDRLIPLGTSRKWARKMRWRRNPCELVAYDACGHSFFNFNVHPRLYESTINQADQFLVNLGMLPPDEDGDTVYRRL